MNAVTANSYKLLNAMEQDRKTINNAANKWWQEAPQERCALCLMAESLNNKENGGSITMGGNATLLTEALYDAMIKSPEFVNILRNAITAYNNEKVSMN